MRVAKWGDSLAVRIPEAVVKALVLAAAAEAGCTALYTEDLQHGRHFGTVAVRNPFAS